MLSSHHILVGTGGSLFRCPTGHESNISVYRVGAWRSSKYSLALASVEGGRSKTQTCPSGTVLGRGSLLRTIFITIFFVGAPFPGRGLLRVF